MSASNRTAVARPEEIGANASHLVRLRPSPPGAENVNMWSLLAGIGGFAGLIIIAVITAAGGQKTLR
jgi:hypothetical protein